MGNYYSYQVENQAEWNKVASNEDDVPTPFIEKERIENLILEGWTQSKRWDGIADPCILSSQYPDLTLKVTITDEDSDDVRLVAFKNGKFTLVLEQRSFPELNYSTLQEPKKGKNEWNLRTLHNL